MVAKRLWSSKKKAPDSLFTEVIRKAMWEKKGILNRILHRAIA